MPSSVFSSLSLLDHSKSKSSKVFYNLYTGNDIFVKTSNIVKWEEELGKQFMSIQWQSAITWTHKSSYCANHREQFHKLLSRCCFTPLRLAKAYPTTTPFCWRSCGSTGSLFHVFWSCPYLTPFWDNVRGLISQLTQILCPFQPEFFFLLLNIESVLPKNRRLVCNILHAARLLIARRWKSVDIPSLLELNNMVSMICIYEKTIATYKGSLQPFMHSWDSWLQIYPNLSWFSSCPWVLYILNCPCYTLLTILVALYDLLLLCFKFCYSFMLHLILVYTVALYKL